MQQNLFTNVEPTSVSPAIAKLSVSRSTFYQGDCLIEMNKIADKSVDMILCDLPYGTTKCKWDIVIPFQPLWKHYERIIKDNGSIVLTAQQPFTACLIFSNINLFNHNWVWKKNVSSNFQLARHQPIKMTEDVLIFTKGGFTYNAKNKCTYNPIMSKRDKEQKTRKEYSKSKNLNEINYRLNPSRIKTDKIDPLLKLPINIIDIPKTGINIHPTQKPVELMEYLIKTYTNEGETVLDNCMGSGTTGVACKKTGRHFIGIEKDEKYFEIAVSRVTAYCG